MSELMGNNLKSQNNHSWCDSSWGNSSKKQSLILNDHEHRIYYNSLIILDYIITRPNQPLCHPPLFMTIYFEPIIGFKTLQDLGCPFNRYHSFTFSESFLFPLTREIYLTIMVEWLGPYQYIKEWENIPNQGLMSGNKILYFFYIVLKKFKIEVKQIWERNKKKYPNLKRQCIFWSKLMPKSERQKSVCYEMLP